MLCTPGCISTEAYHGSGSPQQGLAGTLQGSSELDPNKLMALVAEINVALDEREKKRNTAVESEKDARQVYSKVVLRPK